MELMRFLALAVTLAALASGCQSAPRARTVASAEPALNPAPDGGTTVTTAPPPQTVGWVDRHPLFYKPRDYYESSGNNKIVKAAAATVVGIPVGMFGELRQIVTGNSPESKF
jgi:hypothetical protein